MMRVTFNTPNMSMAQSNPSALRFGEGEKKTPQPTPKSVPANGNDGGQRSAGAGSDARKG